MDVTELRQLISKPEWADVELKTSKRAFPKDAASTLCAFANCGGGYLILGIDEKQLPNISGIDKNKLDEVQNQCLDLLKNTQKFSSALLYDTPSLMELDGRTVLVIQVQDSKRQNKPVKLKEKGHWVTYVRKGARDEIANDHELAQMLLDANYTSVTDQLLDLDVEQCFNANTLKWYRKVFESRHNQKFYALSDLEFLDELGLVRENNNDLKPTKAAILLFGSEKSLNHSLARNVVDAFWFSTSSEATSGVERWQDRRPAEHETLNLFEVWRVLSDRYMYWAEQPFDIDDTSLQRNNETPDYIGFREATVNLLVHQDFADQTRVPKITFYTDSSEYWNPGDSLVTKEQMTSGQSKSRNPLVIQTFLRVGLSERAGSGIKGIYRSWHHLDRPEPVIDNNLNDKTFQITLGKKPQFTALQETIQDKIGVKLTDMQARVFAATLESAKTVEMLEKILTVNSADVYPATDHLVRQGLLQALPEGYQAMAHFAQALPDLQTLHSDQARANEQDKVTKLPSESAKSDQANALVAKKVTKLKEESDQADQLITTLDKKHRALIQAFDGQMDLKSLMEIMGVTHRTHFKTKHLQPMINEGVVSEVHPDKANHPEQGYFLTPLGLAIKAQLAKSG